MRESETNYHWIPPTSAGTLCLLSMLTFLPGDVGVVERLVLLGMSLGFISFCILISVLYFRAIVPERIGVPTDVTSCMGGAAGIVNGFAGVMMLGIGGIIYGISNLMAGMSVIFVAMYIMRGKVRNRCGVMQSFRARKPRKTRGNMNAGYSAPVVVWSD